MKKKQQQNFRNNLDGHGSALSVVLLQNKNSFPTGKKINLIFFKESIVDQYLILVDDVYSTERDQLANNLCTHLDIHKRSLSVLPILPQPDNLSAWIERFVKNEKMISSSNVFSIV